MRKILLKLYFAFIVHAPHLKEYHGPQAEIAVYCYTFPGQNAKETLGPAPLSRRDSNTSSISSYMSSIRSDASPYPSTGYGGSVSR